MCCIKRWQRNWSHCCVTPSSRSAALLHSLRRDAAPRARQEHEDLVHPGPPRVAFHWVARFADHTEFERPPLGHLDRVTGRLRFNHTLADLLAAIAREAPRPQARPRCPPPRRPGPAACAPARGVDGAGRRRTWLSLGRKSSTSSRLTPRPAPRAPRPAPRAPRPRACAPACAPAGRVSVGRGRRQAPLSDYEENMKLLIAALQDVNATVAPRTCRRAACCAAARGVWGSDASCFGAASGCSTTSDLECTSVYTSDLECTWVRARSLPLLALTRWSVQVLWRTGDALHDATLDAAWDFATRPGRYMNDPRMQRANAIAVQRFRQGAPTRRPRPPARG